MSGAVWGLAVSVFFAATVEVVEALTIVLAMGMTRGWKSVWAGIGTALVALVGFTAVTGYALATWLPRSALQLVVGTMLLIFGLQWMRKAILRSAGRKALHDEALIYEKQAAAARAAGQDQGGLDWFAFVISFKGVFLEGVEVVFIVITFGLNAHDVPVAAAAAAAAAIIVAGAGAVLHAPLTKVPENTLKYGVGLLLTSFGSFWAIEGLGVLRSGGDSLSWPLSDAVLLVLVPCWFLLSRALVVLLRTSPTADGSGAARPALAGGIPAHKEA